MNCLPFFREMTASTAKFHELNSGHIHPCSSGVVSLHIVMQSQITIDMTSFMHIAESKICAIYMYLMLDHLSINRKSRMSNSVQSSNLSTTRQEIATKDDDSLSDVNTILLPAASTRPQTVRCSTAASSKFENTANRSHLTSQGNISIV